MLWGDSCTTLIQIVCRQLAKAVYFNSVMLILAKGLKAIFLRDWTRRSSAVAVNSAPLFSFKSCYDGGLIGAGSLDRHLFCRRVPAALEIIGLRFGAVGGGGNLGWLQRDLWQGWSMEVMLKTRLFGLTRSHTHPLCIGGSLIVGKLRRFVLHPRGLADFNLSQHRAPWPFAEKAFPPASRSCSFERERSHCSPFQKGAGRGRGQLQIQHQTRSPPSYQPEQRPRVASSHH